MLDHGRGPTKVGRHSVSASMTVTSFSAPEYDDDLDIDEETVAPYQPVPARSDR